VFLEAAHLIPSAIIGRGRKLGLHTDAGHRFERGVGPDLPRQAIEVATRLIVEIAGGSPGPITEAVLPDALPQPRRIGLRRARLARLLGSQIGDAEVERILRALGLEVAANSDGWEVTAPTRRFDLAIEEDLVATYFPLASRHLRHLDRLSNWLGRAVFAVAQWRAERAHSTARRDLLDLDDYLGDVLAFSGGGE